MRRWSETAGRVAATTKTGEKTTILAAYLAGLTPDELPVAAVFLTGRPFPEADQRSLGVGWSGLAGAVLRTAGADDDALRAAYDRSSDISTAVTEVLEAAGHAPDPAVEPTLVEVRSAFDAIEAASGAAAKAVHPGGAARPCRAADRRCDRQGARRRAPDRSPRGPPGGGDREGVRAAPGRRQAGGDADR